MINRLLIAVFIALIKVATFALIATFIALLFGVLYMMPLFLTAQAPQP